VTPRVPLPDLRRAAHARTEALARRFGDALRVGEGAAAERIVDDALATGMSPAGVQSLVITPAMVRIGELWEDRVIGVADEHLATSISNRALIRLFEAISVTRRAAPTRERVLLAAVEGQRHVLGLRMVADVLEGAGFDVLYLGEDVPAESLRASVARHRPAVVGLAFGIAADVSCLADALFAIHETAPRTRIMLGGRAVPPALCATGYPVVPDTIGVVDAVDALLAAPPQPLPAVVEFLRSHESRLTGSREPPGDGDPVAEVLARSAEHAVGIARDHVRRAEAYRAAADPTQSNGLGDRRTLGDALNALASDGGAVGALLVIDVDAFGAVNDDQGPAAGDRLLRKIGQAIVGVARPGDTVARFGGDEFAVLLPGAPPAVADEIGRRIRTAVDALAARVTVSIGIAQLTTDRRTTLLAAEAALCEAKTAGGDRAVASHRRAPAADGPAMPAIYVSMSRLAIPAERAPELVAAFRNRLRLADEADGFIDLQVWQSDRDPGEILMVSRWRDRSAFKTYMKSPEHRASHERIDPDLKRDIGLRRLEHLHTYEVVSA